MKLRKPYLKRNDFYGSLAYSMDGELKHGTFRGWEAKVKNYI